MRGGSVGPESIEKLEAMVSTRSTITIGLSVVALFFAVFLAWGGSVPLSTAAIATGVVGVEGNKKLVQHLEGGIVSNILVAEGDEVVQGQLLVALSDVEIKSRLQELKNRYINSGAEYARWTAELQGTSEIGYPDWLLQLSGAGQINAVKTAQDAILNARLAVMNEAQDNLALKLARANEELKSAKNRVRGLEQKRSLVNSELAEYRLLEKKGMVTRTQLFDLQKELTNLDLDINDSRSDIKLAQQETVEWISQVSELKSTRQQEIIEKRTALGTEIESLKQQLAILESELERTSITAPIDGYVVNSIVHTVGGVVAAGQVIMEVMPTEERLLVESRVDAKDRDSVRVGQRSEVRFTAFSKRSTLPVEGIVKLISADSAFDPESQAAFYRVIVELVEDPGEALNGARIYPGMQADVLIVTGSQTFLQYLTAPISRSFNRAFRED